MFFEFLIFSKTQTIPTLNSHSLLKLKDIGNLKIPEGYFQFLRRSLPIQTYRNYKLGKGINESHLIKFYCIKILVVFN